MERLTAQEEEAMRRLWQLGDGSVKDVLALYPEPQIPYTTLASVIKNLKRKQYVKERRVGSSYLYIPLISEADYKRESLSRMVNNYFDNSYKDVVSFFVQDQKLSPDELKELLDMIK